MVAVSIVLTHNTQFKPAFIIGINMAPGLTSDIPIHPSPSEQKGPSYPEPLKLSGALKQFSYEDTTPVIGREFHNVNIVDDLMNNANADELLRDLAITSTVTPHRSPPLRGGRRGGGGIWEVPLLTNTYSLPAGRSFLSRPRQPHQRATKAVHK